MVRYLVAVLFLSVGVALAAPKDRPSKPAASRTVESQKAAPASQGRPQAYIELYGQGTVRVSFKGKYGLASLAGKIVRLPKGDIELATEDKKTVHVPWIAVKSFEIKEDEFAGNTDRGFLETAEGTHYRFIHPRPVFTGGMMPGAPVICDTPKMPDESLILSSPSVGKISIKVQDLRSLSYEASTGEVVRLPSEPIELEIAEGQKITISWSKVASFQRQPAAGTVGLYLLPGGDMITGKLARPLKGSIVLEIRGKPVAYPAREVLRFTSVRGMPEPGQSGSGGGGFGGGGMGGGGFGSGGFGGRRGY